MDATGSRCRVELLAAFVPFLLGAPTSSLFLSFLARWPPAQTFLHDLHGHNRQQVSCRTLGPAFCLLDFRFLPLWGTDNLTSFFPSSRALACLVSRESDLAFLLRSLIKRSPPPPPQYGCDSVCLRDRSVASCSSSSGSFSLQAHGASNFSPPQPTRVLLQCPKPPEGLDE